MFIVLIGVTEEIRYLLVFTTRIVEEIATSSNSVVVGSKTTNKSRLEMLFGFWKEYWKEINIFI